MNVLFGVLILCLFFPQSTCKADTEPLCAASNPHLHTGIFKIQDPHVPSKPDLLQISYGFTNVKLYGGPAPEVNIDHPLRSKIGVALSLIGTAEAAVPSDDPRLRSFEKICNMISDAGKLEDLRPLLLDKSFALLKAKVEQGVSQYVVLVTLQSIRPQKIHIIDSRVEEGRAELVVSGVSMMGPVQGLVHMVKVDGAWKLEDEGWYVARQADRRDNPLVMVFKSLSDADQYVHPDVKNRLTGTPSHAVVHKGMLPLSKIDNNRRKRAMMFVFLMDQDKADFPGSASVQGNPRGRMHVMGPKKIFTRQNVTEDKYPVDVSSAKYDDGYAPQEWNFVLPSGKPHEVTVSWLWSF